MAYLEKSTGHFRRTYWYERGSEHGNPDFNTRFRVNAPEASLHPEFMYRDEVRGNGMLQILIAEDLAQLEGAELYCELWGGHPGTANKRVSVNGRATYPLPEVGTAAGHCTHQYPTLPLQLTDLVNGYNVFQFACDQGEAFWGHFIVDNASLSVIPKAGHPALQAAGLTDFHASVAVAPGEQESFVLHLQTSDEEAVSRVEFLGYYQGYDENGNSLGRDWHGFSKDRAATAILGTATEAPFSVVWDTTMLPEQAEMRVYALVHFKSAPALSYHTEVTPPLATPARPATVRLYPARDLPAPFWSRDGQVQRCSLPLDVDPAHIARAQLHIVVWDGGRGTIDTPVTLNGTPLPVVAEGQHDVLYRVLDIDPQLLTSGSNEITVVSNTEHHGIEVLLPGPALMVRAMNG